MIHCFVAFLLLLCSPCITSFGTTKIKPVSWSKTRGLNHAIEIKRHTSTLLMAGAVVTTPSPDEAAQMGARDWPQQIKKGTWTEEIPDGDAKIRYVLEGEGTLVSTVIDSRASSSRIGPGTLIEATGPVKLEWTVKDKAGNNEIIILTPGYEQQGLLFAVAGVFLALCGSLVIFS